MDIPIACTLSGPELAERRRTILDLVRKAKIRTTDLPHGYVYEFPMEAEMSEQLNTLVELERQCCRFLEFNLVHTPTAIRLEVTGPPEAIGIIDDFFGGLDKE